MSTLAIVAWIIVSFLAGGGCAILLLAGLLYLTPDRPPSQAALERDDAEDDLAQLLADGDEPSLRAYRRRTLAIGPPSSATIYPRNAQ